MKAWQGGECLLVMLDGSVGGVGLLGRRPKGTVVGGDPPAAQRGRKPFERTAWPLSVGQMGSGSRGGESRCRAPLNYVR